MNPIVVIPARGGSKGLPGKNLYPINNIPLLKYTLHSALEVSDKVYVSSDDQQILDYVQQNGATPILRPECFASDTSSTEVVLQHAISVISSDDDYCMYLSPCDPIRPNGLLSGLINNFLSHSNRVDSMFFGRTTHRHYWDYKDGKLGGLAREYMSTYTPRQTCNESLVLECTGLGLITKTEFWRKGQRFGGTVDTVVVPEGIPEIDIHGLHDIVMIESLFEKFPNLNPFHE